MSLSCNQTVLIGLQLYRVHKVGRDNLAIAEMAYIYWQFTLRLAKRAERAREVEKYIYIMQKIY